ncbi:hypothetical protein BFO_2317 [Tannerella forsythia 92A2]|uniref:Uncharacterized protein n=1 Tax=Tannerella forsythia (strain ATCC 43037 / JCM 10827 / CCUG 21028 A / KCTC 5666 / FDC 338) TaxID=203275 RepID=G8UJZ3_TANFA|nr:hypothetical protein BFO_2317 [Tannerella forsythia 92A2]
MILLAFCYFNIDVGVGEYLFKKTYFWLAVFPEGILLLSGVSVF